MFSHQRRGSTVGELKKIIDMRRVSLLNKQNNFNLHNQIYFGQAITGSLKPNERNNSFDKRQQDTYKDMFATQNIPFHKRNLSDFKSSL